MASNERLTKRVKKIEEWVKENEELGGPKGILDTVVVLINSARDAQNQANALGTNMQNLKNLLNEFLMENDMGEDWNKFLEDKENAVQEQQAEEVSVQEQAESSEEASEAPEEKE